MICCTHLLSPWDLQSLVILKLIQQSVYTWGLIIDYNTLFVHKGNTTSTKYRLQSTSGYNPITPCHVVSYLLTPAQIRFVTCFSMVDGRVFIMYIQVYKDGVRAVINLDIYLTTQKFLLFYHMAIVFTICLFMLLCTYNAEHDVS